MKPYSIGLRQLIALLFITPAVALEPIPPGENSSLKAGKLGAEVAEEMFALMLQLGIDDEEEIKSFVLAIRKSHNVLLRPETTYTVYIPGVGGKPDKKIGEIEDAAWRGGGPLSDYLNCVAYWRAAEKVPKAKKKLYYIRDAKGVLVGHVTDVQQRTPAEMLKFLQKASNPTVDVGSR